MDRWAAAHQLQRRRIRPEPQQHDPACASRCWPMRVERKGSQITCILTSAEGNPRTPADGRQWYETEYQHRSRHRIAGYLLDRTRNLHCLRLHEFADVPWTRAARGHPDYRKRNGSDDPQLTSIADTDSANTSLFTPTAQMISQGPATALQLPSRFAMPGSAPVPASAVNPHCYTEISPPTPFNLRASV